MDRLFVIALFTIAEGCMLWLVVDGILTRSVLTKTGVGMAWGRIYKIKRDTQPVAYWSLLSLYALSAGCIALFLYLIAFRAH